MVEQRMSPGDVARVSRAILFAVLEQGPHARPHPQGPCLLESRHEALAALQHRVDLRLDDRMVVGIVSSDVGRADHADRLDRNDDVAVGRQLGDAEAGQDGAGVGDERVVGGN